MPTLDELRKTERNLLVVEVALSRLLQEEPVVSCWMKTQLAWAKRLVHAELVELHVRIAEEQVASGKGRFVSLDEIARDEQARPSHREDEKGK